MSHKVGDDGKPLFFHMGLNGLRLFQCNFRFRGELEGTHAKDILLVLNSVAALEARYSIINSFNRGPDLLLLFHFHGQGIHSIGYGYFYF